jgi:hypothetical protein
MAVAQGSSPNLVSGFPNESHNYSKPYFNVYTNWMNIFKPMFEGSFGFVIKHQAFLMILLLKQWSRGFAQAP